MASLGLNLDEQKAVDRFRKTVVEPSMHSLVILDFWAEWCGPCKALTPMLEKVAGEYAAKGVVLAKINVDEDKFIAAQFQVRSIPTVYALFRGQPVADLTNARSESQLKGLLDQLLAKLPIEAGGAEAAPDLSPLLAMGEEVLASGDAEQAIGIYGQIVEIAPDSAAAQAGLIRALGEAVGDDGGLLSRSPIGQVEAIALLTRLAACYRATRRDPPAQLQSVLTLLVPPLLALLHGDGSLGSWQGGWALGGDAVASLIAASGVRTRPLRDARQWGYQRVAAGKSLLQFDAAPPPLARHARNGCASTLAFELSHAGQRIITNCGGAAAAGGLLPVRLEQGLRASAAHSTLVLDDANSTAVLINGRLGTGVSEVEVDRRSLTPEEGRHSGFGATRIEASHDGYTARYGLIHRRILILRDDGTELRGEDLLLPKGKGKRGKVGFAVRFHLGPTVEVGLSDDRQGAGLALPDGSYWQFRSGSGEITIEDSIWADEHGRPVPTRQLVIQGLVSRGGGNFAWLLKKMG